MAEIIDSTLTCPFCNCKFKITSEDIKIAKEYAGMNVFGEHYIVNKQIECPVCKELVVRKIIGYEYPEKE